MLINKSFVARITVLHKKVHKQAEDRECSHGKIHQQDNGVSIIIDPGYIEFKQERWLLKRSSLGTSIV